MALTLSTTYNGTTAGAASALKNSTTNLDKDKEQQQQQQDLLASSTNNDAKPTSNVSELKKIMDENGDTAKSIKESIIRAAVHASRSGRHAQSFRSSNGETYPDVSKAFAAYGGIKPCVRCKSNKQGAYHCRLRRRHKDIDYDGGNSLAILAPLYSAPMESLLLN
jgi:hypothetical protein